MVDSEIELDEGFYSLFANLILKTIVYIVDFFRLQV